MQAETAEVLKKMEAARVRGADPASAAVLALSRRFAAIRDRVAGADKAFHDKLRSIAAQSPGVLRASGVSSELGQYVRLAREALERAEAPSEAPMKGRGTLATQPAKRSAR